MRLTLKAICLIPMVTAEITLRALPVFAEPQSIQAFHAAADQEEIRNLWEKYGSIPGGITLEGPALGFPTLQHVAYDPAKNTFILNENLRYISPVSRGELREIADAIEKEDQLGFSFQSGETVYGALPPAGVVTENLKIADKILSRQVFGPFPQLQKTKGTSVHFRFGNYRFAETGGYLNPAAGEMEIMLIPVLRQKDEKGNYLPDYKSLETDASGGQYFERVRKMIADLKTRPADAGPAEKAVEKIFRYGEIAAFLRSAKSQNTDLDSLKL